MGNPYLDTQRRPERRREILSSPVLTPSPPPDTGSHKFHWPKITLIPLALFPKVTFWLMRHNYHVMHTFPNLCWFSAVFPSEWRDRATKLGTGHAESQSLHVGSVAYKLALGQVYSEFFGFPLSVSLRRGSPYSPIICGMNSRPVSGCSSETVPAHRYEQENPVVRKPVTQTRDFRIQVSIVANRLSICSVVWSSLILWGLLTKA
jgi:hypothetical protein